MAVNKVSESTKNAILRKSAQTLPNRPTEQGYTAEEIKQRLYKPLIDNTFSAITEIDRIVDEINDELDTKSTTIEDFINNSKISANYKRPFSASDWVLDATSGLYKFQIPKTDHLVEDYREIRTTMYIINKDGEYQQVNQYTISTAGTVTAYSDAKVAGVILVGINKDAYIMSDIKTDVNLIVGLADVAKTGSFNDLKDKPDYSQLEVNEQNIANIISGSLTVGRAANADSATEATYAATAGHASDADSTLLAEKAKADEDGYNFKAKYCRNDSTYPNLTAGYATRARNDEDGNSIKNNYAKQSGTYANLTAGRATQADNATVAANATLATTAQKALTDDKGRTFSQTYPTGLSVTYETITVEMRVGNKEDGSGSVDLFRNSTETFTMTAFIAKDINGNNKKIIFANLCREIQVKSNRYDMGFLFVRIIGLDIPNYPYTVRLTSESYGYGNSPNAADRRNTATINGNQFLRYNLFDEGYDFNNGHFVLIEMFG